MSFGGFAENESYDMSVARLRRQQRGKCAVRSAHSRRHGGGRAARPQSDRNLAAGRHRRAHRWPEGAARGQSMGGQRSEAWRSVLDDLIGRGLRRAELLIRGWRPRTGEGHRRRLGWCAGTEVHRAQA